MPNFKIVTYDNIKGRNYERENAYFIRHMINVLGMSLDT